MTLSLLVSHRQTLAKVDYAMQSKKCVNTGHIEIRYSFHCLCYTKIYYFRRTISFFVKLPNFWQLHTWLTSSSVYRNVTPVVLLVKQFETVQILNTLRRYLVDTEITCAILVISSNRQEKIHP